MPIDRKTTPGDIRRLVKKWVKALNLSHWGYELIFDDEDIREDCDAQVWTHHQYEFFRIRFHPERFPDWPSDHVEHTVVHELLHVHFKRLSLAYEATATEVEKVEVQRVLEDRYDFEEECLIDRLAGLLVTLI